jgi:hypothetical protein
VNQVSGLELIGTLVDEKLKLRLGQDALQRDCQVLSAACIEVKPDSLNLSQAKRDWATITRDAEQGKVTVIERNGMKLILISADKLFDVAEQSRRERTFADMFAAYPGVATSESFDAHAPAGPVQELDLPAGEPAV